LETRKRCLAGKDQYSKCGPTCGRKKIRGSSTKASSITTPLVLRKGDQKSTAGIGVDDPGLELKGKSRKKRTIGKVKGQENTGPTVSNDTEMWGGTGESETPPKARTEGLTSRVEATRNAPLPRKEEASIANRMGYKNKQGS